MARAPSLIPLRALLLSDLLSSFFLFLTLVFPKMDVDLQERLEDLFEFIEEETAKPSENEAFCFPPEVIGSILRFLDEDGLTDATLSPDLFLHTLSGPIHADQQTDFDASGPVQSLTVHQQTDFDASRPVKSLPVHQPQTDAFGPGQSLPFLTPPRLALAADQRAISVHLTAFQSALSYAVNFQLAVRKKAVGETFSVFPSGTFARPQATIPSLDEFPRLIMHHHAFLSDASIVFSPVTAAFTYLEALGALTLRSPEPYLVDWPSTEFFLRGIDILDASQLRYVLRRFFSLFELTTKKRPPLWLRNLAPKYPGDEVVLPLFHEATLAFRDHILESVYRKPPYPQHIRFPPCKGAHRHAENIWASDTCLFQFLRDMTFIAIFHPSHRILGLLRPPVSLHNVLTDFSDPYCHCLVPFCRMCDRPSSLIGLSKREADPHRKPGEFSILDKMAAFVIQPLVDLYFEKCNGFATPLEEREDHFWRAFFTHPEMVARRKLSPFCLCWTASLSAVLNSTQ